MNMKKIVASASALALTAAVAVGGTLAWLQAETNTVKNTFTVGNVAITLTEYDQDNNLKDATGTDQDVSFKVSPGMPVTKAADIGVTAGSEACYVFVKVTKGSTFSANFSEPVMDDAWTALGEGYEGIYYADVNAVTAQAGTSFNVLADDQLTVLGTASEDTIDANTTLSFQAYAIQSAGIEAKDGKTAPEVAWDIVSDEG